MKGIGHKINFSSFQKSTFWFAWSDIGIDKPNWKSSKITWQVNL